MQLLRRWIRIWPNVRCQQGCKPSTRLLAGAADPQKTKPISKDAYLLTTTFRRVGQTVHIGSAGEVPWVIQRLGSRGNLAGLIGQRLHGACSDRSRDLRFELSIEGRCSDCTIQRGSRCTVNAHPLNLRHQ